LANLNSAVSSIPLTSPASFGTRTLQAVGIRRRVVLHTLDPVEEDDLGLKDHLSLDDLSSLGIGEDVVWDYQKSKAGLSPVLF
jgi:hypothetical protein